MSPSRLASRFRIWRAERKAHRAFRKAWRSGFNAFECVRYNAALDELYDAKGLGEILGSHRYHAPRNEVERGEQRDAYARAVAALPPVSP